MLLPFSRVRRYEETRRIVTSTFVSLDGLMVGEGEDMSWVTSDFDGEMGEDYMRGIGAILVGRKTYEIFSAHWPKVTEAEEPGADLMNSTPKIVFSSTLQRAPWGKHLEATIVKEITPETVQRLKEQAGRDMILMGSASIFQRLSALGLVDEYRLFLHPIVLGKGKSLFAQTGGLRLRLMRTKIYSNSTMLLDYAPIRSAGATPQVHPN